MNQLQDNGTTIHWHGLRQYKSNTQDGVPGITECPLAPGQSKTYNFQATQYGTSWYHSHFSCQYGDGVLGPIVVNGPATANYDLDLGPLPITDWYYGTVNMHAARVEHVNAGPPEADNGLINGTMVGSNGGSYARTTLIAGKKHRVRLINTAVDNHFMVGLDGHQMQVITADFVPIVPYNASWIFLGIGQRYDVIITADQMPGSYWFRAEVQDQAGCGTNFGNGNIKSIFAYAGHTAETPITSKTAYAQRCNDETDLVPYWNSYVPDGTMVTPTVLQTSINQSTAADGTLTLYWNVNGSSLDVDWSEPTLRSVRTGRFSFAQSANVITLPTSGQWTYWVIEESAGSPFTVNVPHPIHLHGHDFFVLGTGHTAWKPVADIATLNYNNPPRRDVAMLPSGGWLALAFRTDNPGAWIMHCHIAWHADEGFAVQFLESAGSIQSVDPLSMEFDDQCAAWNDYYPARAPYRKHDSGV
nr:laccase-3 [Quercus suber]